MKIGTILVKVILALVVIAGLSSCTKQGGATVADSNVDYYTCTMHPSVHSKTPGKCPICSMDLVPVLKKVANTDGSKSDSGKTADKGPSSMPSPSANPQTNKPSEFSVPVERQQQIGVTYSSAERRPIQISIRSVAVLEPDQAKIFEYVARVDGYIQELKVTSPGEQVNVGDPLVTIYSPDLRSAEKELVNLLNDFPEVYASAHIPIPSTGGLDLKLGKFVTLEGAETIDPRTNVFYSHSYIFNFGIPFNNTGFQSVVHVNKYLDLYAGLNRGVNTSIQDNNHSIAFEGGIGLNLLDGNLTTLAVTHAGPEDPQNNHDWRYLNDITTTWKITKNFTAINDLNLIYDSIDGGKWGGGGAQYFTYSVNDWLQLGVRGEIWRDSSGFYVAQFRANNDFIHFERGDNLSPSFPVDPSNLGGGNTTYLEVTGGVTIKPPMPKPIAGLLIRPEVRYDRALTNTTPFNQGTKQDQWTIGFDAIIEF